MRLEPYYILFTARAVTGERIRDSFIFLLDIFTPGMVTIEKEEHFIGFPASSRKSMQKNLIKAEKLGNEPWIG